MFRDVKRFVLLPLLAVSACNCDESIGGISAQIELVPESLDFGQVAVNSPLSSSRSILVTCSVWILLPYFCAWLRIRSSNSTPLIPSGKPA